MKYSKPAITLLVVAAFAAGCNKPPEGNSAAETKKATAQQFDKVEKDTKAAAEDMKEYTYAKKAEFCKQMQTQLAALNKDLDDLSAKVERSSDTAKAEAKPRLDALRQQTAKLNKQLDEARNATESTWNDVKTGFLKAYDDVKEAFKESRQWASDQIAP